MPRTAYGFGILVTKMSGEKSSIAAGLVTSDSIRPLARWRRSVLLIAGAVAVIAIVAGIWFALTKTALFSPAMPLQHKDLATLSPSEAIKAAQQEVGTAVTAGQKAAAYMDLGQSYMRASKTPEAIKAYQQAVASSSSSATGGGSGSGASKSSGNPAAELAALAQLATAYTVDDDAARTIATFQKIIAILKQSSDPSLTGQIPKYEAAIQRLQSGGHV